MNPQPGCTWQGLLVPEALTHFPSVALALQTGKFLGLMCLVSK